MADGILWNLVSGIDPLGSYSRGIQENNRQQTILQQLAGQTEDRQFKRDRAGVNDQQFQQKFEADRADAAAAAKRADRLYGLQSSRLGRNDDINSYEYAKQNGYAGSFQDWMASKRAGAGEFGLQPIYGTGPDGKPVVLQLGKTGTAVQSKIPEGVNISTGVEKVDLGTQWGMLDKRSGQIVGYMPKDLRGEKREEAIGTTQGKTLPGIGAAETTVNNAIDTINKLRSHPGLDSGTGMSGVVTRQIPGTGAYNFGALNKQAQGQAFMAAREALKGAGQVTDFEGLKGEQAIANLDAAQDKKQYLEALNTLESMMRRSVEDLKRKAGVGAAPQTDSPQVPLDDLLRKYGGQ